MSLSSPVHHLAIPTTLCVRTSRLFDDDCFSAGGSSPVGSVTMADPGSKTLLDQTELVYDHLLADRQNKLLIRIDQKRRQFDEKINELKQTDEQKAAEFKRWADAALVQLEMECGEEMRRLREDYERKFARLERSLIEQIRTSGSWSPAPSSN